MGSNIIVDMFSLTVPVLEKIIRPVIVYIALIIGLRLAGKRELAQMNPFDLVVLLTLSNTVQNAIIGDDTSVTGGLIGAATLLVINYLVVRLVYRNKRIEALAEGTEDALVDHGQVNEKLLDSNMISLNELAIAARREGFDALEDVERAVLEPDGSITFSGKKTGAEAARYQEILTRLDALAAQVSTLQAPPVARQGQE